MAASAEEALSSTANSLRCNTNIFIMPEYLRENHATFCLKSRIFWQMIVQTRTKILQSMPNLIPLTPLILLRRFCSASALINEASAKSASDALSVRSRPLTSKLATILRANSHAWLYADTTDATNGICVRPYKTRIALDVVQPDPHQLAPALNRALTVSGAASPMTSPFPN